MNTHLYTPRIQVPVLVSGVLVAIVLVAVVSGFAAQKPANRLGAHFDNPINQSAENFEEFQQAVAQTAGTHYSSTRAAGGGSGSSFHDDPGLPLGSPGQQQFERESQRSGYRSDDRESNSPATNSGVPATRVRNVVFDPAQQNNSLGDYNPLPQNQQEIGQPSDGNSILISPCAVKFIDDIEVPAQESGQIKSLTVQEGEAVPAGKIVGQIDDELYLRMLQQAKFRLEIAEKKAIDQTSLMAARNEIELNRVIYDRTKKLQSTGSAGKAELDEARFRYQLAQLKEVAAQNEMDSANGEAKVEMARLKEVEEHIRRHTLSVNFDGYVIEIFRHPTEWVNAGEKVMRVARMDRLRVQGVVNTESVNPFELMDRPVTILLNLARGETTTFEGKIVNVGLERQGSNQIMVKAEIQNQPIQGHWVLQPDSAVSMKIHLDGQQANAANGISPR